jgi:ribulose bisphosphate carboxylase small subunit
MTREGDTIVGQSWASKHRGLQIDKVENGYQVKARFSERTRPKGSVWQESVTWRTYVYYTEEEVVAFVRQYLKAEKGELEE